MAKLDTLTKSTCCIIIGSMAGPIFNLPLAGFALNVLGISVFTTEYLNARKIGKYTKLWNSLKLYTKTNDINLYPIVLDEMENKDGKTIRLKLPTGLSSEEFIKKSVHIKEHFKARDVEFIFNNGFLFVNLKYSKLNSTYEYDPIETTSPLAIPIGMSLKGPFILDILKAPHVIVAGETGSGKSTVLRVIITYLIQKKNVNIHLVDLKEGIEFSIFRKSNRIKSFSKNIYEAEKVISKMVEETNRRYKLFYENDCINIEEYNKKFKTNKLDYEIIIIDEFADLSDTNCIDSLQEFFQKARAAGLHGIIATQRPCSKTLDTRLKANIPYIIGLKTMNRTNSQIIIDQPGLEELRGMGHALLKTTELDEIQCFNISPERVRDLIKHTYRNDKQLTFSSQEINTIEDFSFLKNILGDEYE